MRSIITSVLFFLSVLCLHAEKLNLDSLWNIWQDTSQPDTTRVNALHRFAWDGFLNSNPDSAFVLAQMEYGFAERNGLKKAKANALNTQGYASFLKGSYPKALDYYQQSLKIMEEVGDKKGIANVLNNIGAIYKGQKNYAQALDYYQRSLKIKEEIGYQRGIATSLTNIGNIYTDQGNSPQALEYQKRSLKIAEELGDKTAIADCLNNIGIIYEDQGNYPKTLEYYQRSLRIAEELMDKKGVSLASSNIGSLYNKQDNPKRALGWCEKGLKQAEEVSSVDLQQYACECLYKAYKELGNGNKALAYHEQMLALDDSLKTQETTRRLEQMEFQKQLLADSLKQEEEKLKTRIAYEADIQKKKRSRNLFLAGGLFVLLLAVGLWSRLRYVRKSRAIIAKEKDRSENLLLNILPAEIAEELKEKGRAEARDFEMVSILFTDFKEFTQASEKLSAQELVEEINVCFEAFDTICGKYGVEKIKTIGDAYMAAGGLPVPTDDSAKNTVKAALEMQQFMIARGQGQAAIGLPYFEMRAGVHTGPVVAGIVGVKKFQYDIWGDTVNTASRMESNGEVGKVNISQDTYALLKEDPEFTFEPRGKVAAKGKGEVEMWFVTKNSVL